MAAAMGAESSGALPQSVPGLSIDSRSLAPGDAFFAIHGEHRDGHDFVAAALAANAGLAVIAADAAQPISRRRAAPRRGRCAGGFARSCRRRAGTQPSQGDRRHRLGRQDRHQGSVAARAVADGETHASVASYNNHWGVPLSLARCPASARYAVFEIGMNHAGEIAPLTQLVRPHVAIITTIAPVHLEYLGSLTKIADAKAEIFFGVEPGGAAVINRDIAQYAHLKRRAKEAGVARIVSFGEHEAADARLIKCALHPRCSTVEANILGTDLTYKIGAPGRHLVLNSLAVLAAAALVGADLALAALALAELTPVPGRGAPIAIELPGGQALLIDESYNANPASMAAAIALLGQAPVGPQGRRIAVLGDMLELGPKGRALHRALADPVLANAVDLVFCCGPLMHALWEALPAGRRGGYAETSAALERRCCPPSAPATRSWSRARWARTWGRSSRRWNGRIRAKTIER